ncbi:5439_t:CDS:2 [Cetraspora pellucida]|uniref:5439_t:CDS:1 n=1 Tax=Cetraspora pellucida TaxID=1433469 RepID=A0A9N9HG07_9GLOM|nr:5439_t:CDS:2 [Cetraspora pellucida]
MVSQKILTLVYFLTFLLLFPNHSLSSPTLDERNKGGKERIYNLTITKGPSSPDGFKRDIYLINGRFPGPLIEADKDDTIVINVKNELCEDTTVHSHGIFQRGTPWFDGVPGQTQCGIPPNETFTYKYKVCQSGTYWYHSHSRAQYIEGFVGPLVIHDPEDPYCKEYDEEIIVLLQDWYHNNSKTLLATFLSPESEGNEPIPDNVEGTITKRHTVHRLPINIAQRYSVIVTADKPKKKYWMRSEMEVGCFPTKSDTLNPLVKAVVSYDGCDDKCPSTTAWTDKVEDCVDLDSNDLKPYKSQHIPDCTKNVSIVVEFHPDDKNVTRGYINNSTYKIDIKYPTLNKVFDGITKFDADQNAFVIEKNEDGGEHPFHLHGHVFWVLGSGGNGTKLDCSKLNTIDPIQRDTTTVPANGWTVLRFVANNPGVWGFHCHIEWHVQSGLVAQFVAQPDKIKKLNPPDEWKALCPKCKIY